MAYICPFCGIASMDDPNMKKSCYESFEHSGIINMNATDTARVALFFEKCPNCNRVSITLRSASSSEEPFSFAYPPKGALSLPDYVPLQIRSDYMEAVSIVDLSPKAAATLARRCLQGMIHDFWDIKGKNLNAEITALKEKVPASQWKAIDGLRKVGNIGAHMEKDVELIIDVDPNEAKKLLKLIELLIEKWYVARHDEEALFAEITEMATEKEEDRHS